MTATLFVRFAVTGFHSWPRATAHRAYLAAPHRHQFLVEVRIPALHDEREVEFHDLIDLARSLFPGGDLGAQSCETMARELASALAARLERWVEVSVSEDGEAGAIVRIAHSTHLRT